MVIGEIVVLVFFAPAGQTGPDWLFLLLEALCLLLGGAFVWKHAGVAVQVVDDAEPR